MTEVFIATTSPSSNYYLLNAAIGAGKTKALIEFCGHGLIAGQKFIFASPTTDLTDQSYAAFQKRFRDRRAVGIHSGNTPNVAAEIKRHTEEFSGTCAIFCTHSGLLQTPWIANKAGWKLIVDEMPQSVASLDIKLRSDKDSVVGRMIEARPLPNNAKYSALEVLNPELRDLIASDPEHGGVYSKDMHDVARKLQSSHWTLYVLTAQWQNAIIEKKAGRELQVFGVLGHQAFAGFQTTTFASANIEHTLTYLHFSKTGATFRRNRELEKRLRYEVHPLGHKLEIYYGIDQPWSKQKRNVKIDGQSLNDHIAMAAMKLIGDAPFAKLFNKDLEGRDPFGNKGTALPHASFGRNDFQHLHNAAVLPALNPTPAFDKFLREIVGLEADQVHRAIYLEQIGQAAGRISMRNIDDTDSLRKIIVADYGAAQFLHEMYPNSSLHRLQLDDFTMPEVKPVGRPSTRTDEQKLDQKRQAARRQRWRAKNQCTKMPLRIRGVSYVEFPHACSRNTRHEEIRGYIISHWNWRAANPQPYEDFEPQYRRHLIRQQTYSPADLNQYLRECQSRQYADKGLNDLIITSYFDLDQDPAHGHSKSNHVYSQGVMLDFEPNHDPADDAHTYYDFTPDEIHAILGLEMTIYSSWNHTPESQRFRVCIPSPPMNYDQQECVRRCLVRRLQEAQPNKVINVDESKLNAVSMMYLPCDRPDAFLTEYEGNALDHYDMARTCPPDIVDKILALSPLTEPEAPQQTASQSLSEAPHTLLVHQPAFIARAIHVWRTTGCSKGEGRRKFWSLSRKLIDRTSLTRQEIENLLWEQAAFATNPPERRDAINGLLKDCYR